MNKEQELALIEEARIKYPSGTKFKSAFSGVIYISEGNYYFYDGSSKGVRDKSNPNSPWFYCDGKWAKVVEYPKNYVAPSENLLSKLEIW